MFVVYSENDDQKKYLEEDYLYQSNYFAIPLSNIKSLHELIDKTCYQFYQKNQSILIEKLKVLISGLIDLSFSFPLLREILELQKKKDMITEIYRNQIMSMDQFFQQIEPQKLLGESDPTNNNISNQQQFQNALRSHKTFDILDLDSQQLVSLGSFGQYQQFLKQKKSQKIFDQKIIVLQSQLTNDETLQEFNFRKAQSNKHLQQQKDYNIKSFMTPLKCQKSPWSSIPTTVGKNTQMKQNKNLKDISIQDFMNSFRKQKPSAIAQMLLNDESIGKISKKQIKKQNQRMRLQNEIYEKTRTIKSNQYNRNIKNVLLHNKLKQRKKPKTNTNNQNNRLGNVINAYQLRRVSSQIIGVGSKQNISFIGSSGQPFKFVH